MTRDDEGDYGGDRLTMGGEDGDGAMDHFWQNHEGGSVGVLHLPVLSVGR